MANPETIIDSMRGDLTQVLEICQNELANAVQDKDDFVAEKGAAFFTDWFDTASTDITFNDMLAAITAAEAILATFEANRSKLQVVRTR